MKKIRFYKDLIEEIIETLCTICLYLDKEGRRTDNPYALYMDNHFERLSHFSEILRSTKRGKRDEAETY